MVFNKNALKGKLSHVKLNEYKGWHRFPDYCYEALRHQTQSLLIVQQ